MLEGSLVITRGYGQRKLSALFDCIIAEITAPPTVVAPVPNPSSSPPVSMSASIEIATVRQAHQWLPHLHLHMRAALNLCLLKIFNMAHKQSSNYIYVTEVVWQQLLAWFQSGEYWSNYGPLWVNLQDDCLKPYDSKNIMCLMKSSSTNKSSLMKEPERNYLMLIFLLGSFGNKFTLI